MVRFMVVTFLRTEFFLRSKYSPEEKVKVRERERESEVNFPTYCSSKDDSVLTLLNQANCFIPELSALYSRPAQLSRVLFLTFLLYPIAAKLVRCTGNNLKRKDDWSHVVPVLDAGK